MEIFIVNHYYDNGESYEDYREYEQHYYYSCYENAAKKYWDAISRDYEGSWTITKLELDSQEYQILEKAPYMSCKPYYEDYTDDDYDNYNDQYDYDYLPGDPSYDIYEYWKWENAGSREAKSRDDEELDEECQEWLTHEGENLKDFKALEEDKMRTLLRLLNECLNK